LLISYNFMENWLNSTMMDYLTESLMNSERDSVIIRNMQDGLSELFLFNIPGLSCLFVVIAHLISEAYTGNFIAITFCASASAM
ncbi:hypothetical protein S83_039443, partial [Arachis hypogaea]